MRLNYYIFVYVYVYFLASCASFKSDKSQVNELQSSTGAKLIQCESKATIKDLKKNKTHNLNVDVIAVGRERMRIEVSGTLGYGVASILFDDSGTKYVSYPEKKYYEIRDSSKLLDKILKVPLSAGQFYDLLYSQAISSGGWRCNKDGIGRVESCENSQSEVEISWNYMESGEKTIRIVGPLIEISWKFKKIKTEVQYNPGAFVLNAPSGFKTLSL